MAIGDDIILKRLASRENQLMQQADALDVKASVLLVAVTFLAGQSTYFLTRHTTGFIHWDQTLSVLIQVIAGVLLARQLAIQNYSAERSEEYPEWRKGLLTHFNSDGASVEIEMKQQIIEGCAKRAIAANKINERKVTFIQMAYWLSLASFACNLAALVWLIVN